MAREVFQYFENLCKHIATMSFVFRRNLTTLIPPKVASASNLGSNPAAKRMQHIVSFYSKLPRGEASIPKAKSPLGLYRQKYFDTGSGAPLLHASLFFLAVGYGLEYYFHLSHHKEH
ncbi:hypothetical protein KL930_002794 [Ogataea haglerorum]|uniref:Uncharacterized protein n=1 Tax=Ogataea haglerorum TaxID=1937702 RepID=A0AAN6D871_9ASCO|nr:uncharacterized protein KL911_002948 [Ogataea haglerorum]KAG7691883.1 hypothetical protein KL915_004946 [Ogataea haglerorum]KAG7692683.1 hypothetical protein KL951_004930 [Ogataea haglerorum]KAG7702902.1 hypothetical protein KL950_004980 [Ogataea haglerorum]KAG7703001.1 hypothetical protein KL914_005006 [Ogataea haglerorum]KAG7718950.1 hypothetical protein KL913_001948 [Ogataea haglerorum]